MRLKQHRQPETIWVAMPAKVRCEDFWWNLIKHFEVPDEKILVSFRGKTLLPVKTAFKMSEKVLGQI